MIDERHPFADDDLEPSDSHPFGETKSPIGLQMSLVDTMDRSGCKKAVKPKRDKVKEKHLKQFGAIEQSLANIKLTEQLFASGKKQVIFGNVPSKSNCYKIITLRSKKKEKVFSSLGKTPRLEKYEKDFFIQCNVYRNKMMEGYLQIEVDVYYPNQRSDLDNSLKVILDCLQKVKAFENDNKVVDIRIRKFLDKLIPRVEFSLKEAM